MVSCDSWQGRIIDRLSDELGEEDAILLEQHLAECAACASEERLLRALLESSTPAAESAAEDGPERASYAAMEEDLAATLRGIGPVEKRVDRVGRGTGRAGRGTGRAGRGIGRVGRLGILPIFSLPVPAAATVALVCLAALGGVWLGSRHAGGGRERIAVEAGRPTGPEMAPSSEERPPDRVTDGGLAGIDAGRPATPGAPSMSRAIGATPIGFVSAPVDAFALASTVERDTL